jgi:hypothetical protein
MADLIAGTGATANSYTTVDEADIYFEKRLHTSVWDNADPDDKDKSLMWATRLLDEMVKWKGLQVDSYNQLRWPRYGIFNQDDEELSSLDIPQFLKDATAEFAMHLLAADRTLETNRDLTGFKSVQVDVIKIEMDTGNANASKPVMPKSVWSIIKFYGSMYGRQLTLVRA